MLYLNITYFSHLLLNSKFRLLIHLFIVLFIYSASYGYNFIYCMNNTNNIIEAPVNEAINSQAEDIRREVSAYANTQASLLEEIDRKNKFIQDLLQDNNRHRTANLELRKQNGSLGRTIHELRANVSNLSKIANNNYNAYKEQCIASGHAGQHVHELKQELNAARQEIKILRSSVKLMGDVIASLQR